MAPGRGSAVKGRSSASVPCGPPPALGQSADDDAVAALVKLGVHPETAAGYVRRGDAEGAVFDAVLLPARRERTVTPATVAASGGLPVGAIAELMEAFGLPRPRADEAVFTPEEARVLVELGELDELWPAEVRMQVARAYGAMMGSIARAEVQAFQTYTRPHVRAAGGNAEEQLQAIQSAFRRLLPLADPLLLGVHRRWIEHELGQRAVRAAERHAGTAGLPGAVEVTFLFCDLKDFTAYAQSHGDQAAIGAIERFFDVIAREQGESGRFVKSLGDGAMLVYDEPADAVAAGARVIAAMANTEFPGVHASVHRGIAIARSGDYFGTCINVAARLLAFAGRDELLATAEVVEACEGAFEWEPDGERDLRGVNAPVALYKLSRPASPTCL